MTLAIGFFNYSIHLSLERRRRRSVPPASLRGERTARYYRREMLHQRVEREREDAADRYRLGRQ